MKNVRSLLLLVAAVFLISGLTTTAMAEKGNETSISLAAIDSDTFTLNPDMSVALMEWDTTVSPIHVGANKIGYKVMQFYILNDGATVDTLESITFKSFNDKDYSTSKIALYRQGSANPIWSLTNPGAFSENTTLTASGLNQTIDTAAATDSVVFYFTFDSDSSHVDTSYNDLFVGLKITGGGIEMSSSGVSPTVLTDTLMYDNVSLGYGGGGRIVSFDTKPPDLAIGFDAFANYAGCPTVINLGDSLEIFAWDTVGDFEIDTAWAYLSIFGGGASPVKFADSIYVSGADSAMFLSWLIPDTAFVGAGEVAAGFYYLVVGAEDVAGNFIVDSTLVALAIDTKLPTFDGDSVWVSLYYDANSDGIAAVGDTVTINAWMTSNPIGEVTTVTANMTNWGYGAAIPLLDQSGDRKFINKLRLTAGTLDLDADSVDSRFWVTATDNACNSITDSNIAHFAIDNEIPAAPTITYTREYDHDANNIVNIDDSVKITVDAATTSDLAAVCPVEVDLLTSGLGGSQTQCITDTTAAGVYTFTSLVRNGGIYAVDVSASVHTVDITLTDDAGNTVVYSSPAIIYPVDTRPPTAVANLEATRGACAIELSWDAASSPLDDSLYLIFWDGGNGWDATDTSRDAQGHLIFLDTLGSVAAPTTSWTTDGTVVLTNGTTYQFVVRTIDDANNREYNFNRVSEIADCQAPVACVTDPASGGAYGTGNDLNIIAESTDPDIDGVSLYVRIADLGSGTPGPWHGAGTLARPGGGGVFTGTIDSVYMDNTFGCVDDSYELITTAVDEVGNAQSIAQATDTCGLFAFDWFCIALPVELIAVNDTVSPQTSCGFNVTRDDNNTVQIDVSSFTAGETFTVDVWVFRNTGDPIDSTRVFYEVGVDAMPFTFNLNATDFPKGNQLMKIKVIRDDGNMNTIEADLCVPDENAPMATIVRPFDGQYVRQSCTILDRVNVWARINYDSYDFTNTTKVEFYDAVYTAGEAPTFTTPFAVITSMTASDSTWRAMWNNCSYENGAVVALEAVFYDDHGNSYATPFVKVTIDAELPNVALSTNPAPLELCGDNTLHGSVDLIASVTSTPEDLDSVVFYYSLADSPDIFAFYDRAGKGGAASTDGIYKLFAFNTSSLIEGRWYRFRAIGYDITGQVMYDFDGDGLFDDNTFDAVNNTSDALFMIDNTPVQMAISQVEVADGQTFPTPSELLSGAGRVYAQVGSEVTVQCMPIPMGDTCCAGRVEYYMDDTPVASSNTPPYEVTFNPMDYFDPLDIQNHYISTDLYIVFTDCFGQTSDDDIGFYLLDVTANNVVFAGPFDGECVGGEVDMYTLALNAFNVSMVQYSYRAAGSETWIPIGNSTNSGSNFHLVWNTVGLADGQYELGAVSTDAAGNVSDPTIITVSLANTAPTAQIVSPLDLAYVAPGAAVTAEVLTGDPTIMRFYYKMQTSGSWTSFGAPELHEPWVAYFNATSDGWYNLMVSPRNCGGASSESEMITVFLDNTAPEARITSVAGQDAGGNDPDIDVTGMTVVPVTGYFSDDDFAGGNSGIARVAFYLVESNTADTVRVLFIDPADAGYHTAQFDISGLGIGEYYVYARAFDAVGNYSTSSSRTIYIADEEAPTVAIAGFLDGVLYGYDWSGDAIAVLFERYDAVNEEWIGIGVGDHIGSTGIWVTAWTPEEGETYTLRVISGDGSGNYDDTNALTAQFTYNPDNYFTFGTTQITAAVKKNNSNDNIAGVIRTTSPNGAPVVIATYSDSAPEVIPVDRNQQTPTLYQGSFDASDNIYPYGYAVFFVSYPNAAGTQIEINGTEIIAHQILPDFGTNGYVQALDSMVRLSVDDGATDYEMSAIIMESWIPQAGLDQDNYRVIPDPNGYAWYIGCDYAYEDASVAGTKESETDLAQTSGNSGCCFNVNKPAIIRMPYDPEDTTSAAHLAVAWWDPDDNEWEFYGIQYPAYVEGFNTEEHYVEFASECLYGLYAVVTERDLPQTPTISIDLLGDMYCGYFSVDPTFMLKVEDMSLMKKIDTDTWNIMIDDYPIAENGHVSHYFDLHYDRVTNLLTIAPDYGYYDPDDEEWYSYYNHFVESLACGDHTLSVGVKNIQGAYRQEIFDFTIDCAPPTVVFENGYVGKNPTIQFQVTDDLSGVDVSSIHVDVIAVQTTDTNSHNPNQYEQLFFLQTFFPGQITVGEDGMVTIPTTYELEDERAIVVVLYDGTRTEDWQYADPVNGDDWDAYYSDGHGIHDCAGNAQTPIVQILSIDVDAPSLVIIGQSEPVTSLSGCVRMQVADDGDGFDVSGIAIYEDGLPINRVAVGEETTGTYSYNTNTGIITYCVTPGAEIQVTVTDKAGNKLTRNFGSGSPNDIVNATVSMNPWDPTIDGYLTIDYNFTGNSTVKIYDFGGDLVKTLRSTNGTVTWNGATENGTRVASGVYFGEIVAEAQSGSFTTVIKIAVVQK